MLCEQCQKTEATVHVAIVSWMSADLNQHLCESCFPAVEAARTKPVPTAPLPGNVENITATEYLQMSNRAEANGADKPAFRHVCRELERFPATRDRLALEFLRMTWQFLEKGREPFDFLKLGVSFGNSLDPNKASEYRDLLEEILCRSVDDMLKSPQLPSAGPLGRLLLAASALSRLDSQHWTTVLAKLKNPVVTDVGDRCKIIDYIEEHIAKPEWLIARAEYEIRWRARTNKTVT